METKIIKIGNSKGIRLSKTIIEKYNITDRVEIILTDNNIIISPIVETRKGWDEAFKELKNDKSEETFIDDFFEDENGEEW